MKSFALLTALATIVATAAASMTINTPPSIVQCALEPALLSWSGGAPPYFVTVIPGGQTGGTPLKSFDQTSDTSITWDVDVAAGTSITLALRDSTGAQEFSDAVTISGSSDSSCVNSSVAESSSASSGSSGSSESISGGSSATASSSGESNGSSSAGTRLASSPTPSPSSGSNLNSAKPTASSSTANAEASSNGAIPGLSMNAVGLAGVLGAFGAALLWG
ncbi:hypothetical protein M0805_004923 [Coniferiporia weirii]|nr:hypothetical protein M0805_004923 [Coniferiporia weirii]